MGRDVYNAYKGNKPFVFVSYAHADGGRVYPLIDALIADGYRIWYDEGIEPSAEWLKVINEHIEQCSAFVVFVSAVSMSRSQVVEECAYASILNKKYLRVNLEYVSKESIDGKLRAKFAIVQHMNAYNRHSSLIYRDLETALAAYRDVPSKPEPQPVPQPKPQPVTQTKPQSESKPKQQSVPAPKPAPVDEKRGTSVKTEKLDSSKSKSGRKAWIIAACAVLAAALIWGAIALPGAGKKAEDDVQSVSVTDTVQSVSDTDDVQSASDTETEEIDIGTNNSAACEYLDTSETYSVGDHLLFGSYEQDADESNGAEAIEWRVLEVKDDSMILISEYLLDYIQYNQYNEEWTDNTWENCTLREWLNNDFYYAAFLQGEKDKIKTVVNQNPHNESYGTRGGNPTEDKVYCLSIDEAKTYFSSSDDRKAKPTSYASKIGDSNFYNNYNTGWWWLRSPGCDSGEAAYVKFDGFISDKGNYVSDDDDDIGVRPVVSVSLSAES